MNNSNAAAKARRAGIKPSTPPMPTPGQGSNNGPTSTAGLTLPQVISVIDRRLVTLESFMKETKENPTEPATVIGTGADIDEDAGVIVPSEFNTFVDEINNRFQLLAEELETMKNALLKLQTYTMDVNTVLLEKTNVIIPESVTDAIVSISLSDESVVESSKEKEDVKTVAA